jgi:hypothetical protein
MPVEVHIVGVQANLKLRRCVCPGESRLNPDGQHRDWNFGVDTGDDWAVLAVDDGTDAVVGERVHDRVIHATGLGGRRSVPRTPRRNGYCNRIHATDELLLCQLNVGPAGPPGAVFGMAPPTKLEGLSRPSASRAASAHDASFQSVGVAGGCGGAATVGSSSPNRG